MRRGLVLSGLTAFVFALHCGASTDAKFTPPDDDRFVGSIVGAYAAGGGVSLVICEDTAPDSQACKDPVPDIGQSWGSCTGRCHVIRGRGQGAAESIPTEGGCDCGMPGADMGARVDVALGDGSHLSMRGVVAVAPTASDAYAGPMALRVAVDEQHLSPSLYGEVRQDGHLSLRYSPAARVPAGAGVGDAATTGADADADAGDTDASAPSVAWPAATGTNLVFTKIRGPEACP